MADQSELGIAFAPSILAAVDAWFLSRGMGVNSYLLIRDRRDILLWLNALDDQELAELGLERDGIPAHVFGDLFGD